MADLVEIAGLWKKEGRNGAYYSGKAKEDIVIPAGSYINVFKNADASEENRKPQLRVLFSPPEGAPPPRQESYSQRREPSGRRMADQLEDDIPW